MTARTGWAGPSPLQVRDMGALTVNVAPTPPPHSHVIDCSAAEFVAWVQMAVRRLGWSDRRLEIEEGWEYDIPDPGGPLQFAFVLAPSDWSGEGPEPEPFWSFEVWPVKHGRIEVKVWDDMAPPGMRDAFTKLLKYHLVPIRGRPLVDEGGKPEPRPSRNSGRPPDELYDEAFDYMRKNSCERAAAFEEYYLPKLKEERSVYQADIPQLRENFNRAMSRRDMHAGKEVPT